MKCLYSILQHRNSAIVFIYICPEEIFVCPLFNSVVNECRENREAINSLCAGCQDQRGSHLSSWGLSFSSCFWSWGYCSPTSPSRGDPTCLHPYLPTPREIGALRHILCLEGCSAQSVNEFQENNYTEETMAMDSLSVKLVIKALLKWFSQIAETTHLLS